MKEALSRSGARCTVLVVAVVSLLVGLVSGAAGAYTGSPGRGGSAPAHALECSEPKCLSGTRPVVAPARDCTDEQCVPGTKPIAASSSADRISARIRYSGTVRTSARTRVAAINCPPPNPQATGPGSDC